MPQPQKPIHGQYSHCQTCGAPIVWGRTEEGNLIPLDWQEKAIFRYVIPKSASIIEPIDEEEPIKFFFVYRDRMLLRDTYATPPKAYTSTYDDVIPQQIQAWQTHFASCKDADFHRKKKRKKKDSPK